MKTLLKWLVLPGVILPLAVLALAAASRPAATLPATTATRPATATRTANTQAARTTTQPARNATSQPARTDQLQRILAASDEEWKILRPKIDKVQSLQNRIETLERAVNTRNLPTATAPAKQLAADLAAKREARAKVHEELTKAQADLIRLLTVRQELLLFELGIVK